MFGHVQTNWKDLSDEDQVRYRAAYCGLCRTLGKRHGLLSRLALTHDLTFLALLFSSLYEPEEEQGACRCCVHPCKKHGYTVSAYTEYAADMTIALTYHKCLDDWNDNRSIRKKLCASVLRKRYAAVKACWTEQCDLIEHSLEELAEIERRLDAAPDAAAKCFGHMIEALFVYHRDHWEPYLRKLGFGLGRYIYLADAVEHLEKDRKRGHYNPLKNRSATPREMRSTLAMILGEASAAFEGLPLVQDVHLLRNILYSGIWIRYNRAAERAEKRNKQSKLQINIKR